MRTPGALLAGGFALLTASLLTDPALAQDKFALQLFHFNVQYVCGGTIGFTGEEKIPAIDLDNDATEDRIIEESFAPIVELFDRHPSWGVDLEMQGYMLDAIAARHPALLEKLRELAQAGRIDVVSFHYSDQLFIGFPAEDWERSQALTEATFAAHDVPLSRTVFCQEGQAAPAMAAKMAERGYRNMVWPKNLWSYQHGDTAALPLYEFGDIFMVQGGKGFNFTEGPSTLDVTWTFLDDGELLATNDFNPYFTEFFFEDPEAVAEYEDGLLALEEQGYRIATVDQYVEAVKDRVTPVEPPPLLDGTWQPNSTDGVSKWLGGAGIWLGQERDNDVRTLGAQTHRELVAAETIAAEAGLDAREALDAAWRMLFLGQVTDASGINPFRGEIHYGLAHLAEALRIARDVIREGKQALGLASALIDPAAGTVTAAGADGLRGSPADAPLALVVDPGDRSVTLSWEQVAAGHWRGEVAFGPGEATVLSVRVPGALEDTFHVGLALDDATPAAVERSAFSFERFYFALPTGYIGLGGGRFLIKDMGMVHLAAEVVRDEGDVTFTDETVTAGEPQRWVFHVFDGTPEDAAAAAIAINAKRRLVR